MKPTRPRKVLELGVRIPVHVDANGYPDRTHPLLEVAQERAYVFGLVPLVALP